MIQAHIKKEFQCDRDKLWRLITDNQNDSWRSDLSKIEIIDEKHFVEYTKNNFPTQFTIVSRKKLKEYALELENANMKGKWTGLFQELPNGNIQVDFTEEVEIGHFVMRLLAKPYLKNQQKRYLKDLETALQCP